MKSLNISVLLTILFLFFGSTKCKSQIDTFKFQYYDDTTVLSNFEGNKKFLDNYVIADYQIAEIKYTPSLEINVIHNIEGSADFRSAREEGDRIKYHLITPNSNPYDNFASRIYSKLSLEVIKRDTNKVFYHDKYYLKRISNDSIIIADTFDIPFIKLKLSFPTVGITGFYTLNNKFYVTYFANSLSNFSNFQIIDSQGNINNALSNLNMVEPISIFTDSIFVIYGWQFPTNPEIIVLDTSLNIIYSNDSINFVVSELQIFNNNIYALIGNVEYNTKDIIRINTNGTRDTIFSYHVPIRGFKIINQDSLLIGLNINGGDKIKLITRKQQNTITFDRFENKNVSLYPNPCEKWIFIDTEREEYFNIYDLSGNIIKRNLKTNTRNFVEDLPKGIYLVQDSKKRWNKKLIKN